MRSKPWKGRSLDFLVLESWLWLMRLVDMPRYEDMLESFCKERSKLSMEASSFLVLSGLLFLPSPSVILEF